MKIRSRTLFGFAGQSGRGHGAASCVSTLMLLLAFAAPAHAGLVLTLAPAQGTDLSNVRVGDTLHFQTIGSSDTDPTEYLRAMNVHFFGSGDGDLSFEHISSPLGWRNPLGTNPVLVDWIVTATVAGSADVWNGFSDCIGLPDDISGCAVTNLGATRPDDSNHLTFTINAVPEPSSIALALAGCLSLSLSRRRSRAQSTLARETRSDATPWGMRRWALLTGGLMAGGLMATSVQAQSFSYASFADTAGLQINGAATPINLGGRDLMRLTPPQGNTGGSMFSTQAITLADAYSFSTRFTFNMGNNNVNQYGEIGADGIAFLIQPLSNNVGGLGGALGYGGISPSLAVEFDTYSNGGTDPRLPGSGSLSGNDHIAIMLNGDYNNHLAYSIVSPTLDLNSGQDITAFVDYNSANNLLQVRWSTDGLRPVDAGLSYAIDLAGVFGASPVYVGFTASTGADWSEQDIVNWSFNDVYDPISTAPTDTPGSEVPEPSSWTMVMAAIAGAGWAMRRKRRPAHLGVQ